MFLKNINYRGSGDLDNTAAVAAAKKLDDHFKEHVERALANVTE